jgi:type I restriction enzyme S subunit
MKNIAVVLPSKENVQEYCSSMSGLFNSILNNEIEISNLQKIRETLLPKLMSGELT